MDPIGFADGVDVLAELTPEVDMVGRRSVMLCQPECGFSQYLALDPKSIDRGRSGDPL
jgi:hypothetical protein